MFCHLGRRGLSQPVLAGTTGECAALATDRSVVMGFSLSRQELSQPLWYRSRQVRALLWSLFPRSTWAQPATELAVTTGEDDALSSDLLVGVGPASQYVGVHEMLGWCSGFCLFGRRGLSQPLCLRARQVSAKV